MEGGCQRIHAEVIQQGKYVCVCEVLRYALQA